MDRMKPLLKIVWIGLVLCAVLLTTPLLCLAADDSADATGAGIAKVDFRQLVDDAGTIGIIIAVLSVAMVALIVEHIISIRSNSLMPPGMAEEVHSLIAQQQYRSADSVCKSRPSFLSYILSAGLAEVQMGYGAVEKAMEDAAMQQSARLNRKIEYLSVIGTLSPMLGLLGTVWGMILAFSEFTAKANPDVAELAPGISKALITTLFGLSVTVPALASFAFFRNRIDELVAQSSLLAEHVFADFKRSVPSPAKQTGKPVRKRPEDELAERIANQQASRPAPPPGGQQS
ncbi:MAG: MotA/TolQ/ExbB proton channel family protein [Planctomycetes bacterium]|nr:MotA/TolQ/ExbB proton channel family protein [Planctomycetota bacterium]MCH9726607.1 MotA/TolQ/ExbB proton channel family protein [Planctomycetota bacterium]MCH9779276.1 MotA/TolQ/ExbB proton channel family protein [Planctomycetota bacterium]MCH9792341.1 MotA/TolQ/ExbB proton channel family protein [Planctomycetota bacterium]